MLLKKYQIVKHFAGHRESCLVRDEQKSVKLFVV